MLPEELRPEKRKNVKAYDGMNNIFNLAYEVFRWKVHRAIIMEAFPVVNQVALKKNIGTISKSLIDELWSSIKS